MAKIKKVRKYQNSGPALRAKSDATRVEKPAINTRPATKYKYIDLFVPIGKKPSTSDSSNYRAGYRAGVSGGDAGIFSDFQTHMGAKEGKENYKKNSIKKEKTGGKVKKSKTGSIVPKKSSVSKRIGSAKKSIGNRSMKRK